MDAIGDVRWPLNLHLSGIGSTPKEWPCRLFRNLPIRLRFEVDFAYLDVKSRRMFDLHIVATSRLQFIIDCLETTPNPGLAQTVAPSLLRCSTSKAKGFVGSRAFSAVASSSCTVANLQRRLRHGQPRRESHVSSFCSTCR